MTNQQRFIIIPTIAVSFFALLYTLAGNVSASHAPAWFATLIFAAMIYAGIGIVVEVSGQNQPYPEKPISWAALGHVLFFVSILTDGAIIQYAQLGSKMI